MNNVGWVKIHRKLLEWEWYDDYKTFRLFIHLLLKANHKVKNYKGTKIGRGQVMTGLKLLSEQTGLSMQQVRSALSNLKATNEITNQTSNQGTIIQIVKYKDYQVLTNKPTNEQQTNNKPSTTNKNIKNDNNEKNIINRMAEFKNSLQPFLALYGKEMLNDFYLYWTEKKLKGRKMRFEKQETWDTKRRLQRWFRNDFGKKEKPQQKEIVTNR